MHKKHESFERSILNIAALLPAAATAYAAARLAGGLEGCKPSKKMYFLVLCGGEAAT
jgi:hypothetical protein